LSYTEIAYEETNMNEELEAWKDLVEKKLIETIKVWESKMGDDDTTFYTLGIRRALDVVRGEDPEL
jgi:hypothetical protein